MADNLVQFIRGFAAVVQLYDRAGVQGSFVESVCLAANIIDGMLRIGLILEHQLRTESPEILDELLYQSDEDRIVTEREIFRRSNQRRIIDDDLLRELEALYDRRNRVVHRYIISEITTAQVLEIALDYEKAIQRVADRIRELDLLQVEYGLGMTEVSEDPHRLSELIEMVARKHGDEDLARRLANGGG